MTSPVALPGLVAFWDFQDDSFLAQGPSPIRLKPGGAPLEAVSEGVFGPRSLRFRAEGQLASGYLSATAAEAPALNIDPTPRSPSSLGSNASPPPTPAASSSPASGTNTTAANTACFLT